MAANAHSIQIASVSKKPTIDKSHRPACNKLHDIVHEYLNQPGCSPDAAPFSMLEMKAAIKRLHKQRAPGEDGICAELFIVFIDQRSALFFNWPTKFGNPEYFQVLF
mmetsp:Transcript_6728/g.12318  ORF Transcript_6728/g.12318 Transcript_6728/m.12318 type:complete len:107 (+) Transcript_6728:278-598(+)